jgi:hypothetical protein
LVKDGGKVAQRSSLMKVNQKVQKERVFFGLVAASASTTIKQVV